MDVDQDVRKVLNELSIKVEASQDGSIYGDRSKALQDIKSVQASSSTEELLYLLAPTANLQELAIENGWGQEFNNLAGKVEKLLGI